MRIILFFLIFLSIEQAHSKSFEACVIEFYQELNHSIRGGILTESDKWKLANIYSNVSLPGRDLAIEALNILLEARLRKIDAEWARDAETFAKQRKFIPLVPGKSNEQSFRGGYSEEVEAATVNEPIFNPIPLATMHILSHEQGGHLVEMKPLERSIWP